MSIDTGTGIGAGTGTSEAGGAVVAAGAGGERELSVVVVHLLHGPLYRDGDEVAWGLLLRQRSQVADYVAVLGLQVWVDESEGYAYLRSRPNDEVADEGLEIPRLVARRHLSFPVSMLVALLRKRLAEFDASNSETRLVLSRDQIVEMLRLYLPESTNEAKLVDGVGGHINRVVDMGFLRRLRGQDELFEVRRIIKAYVDAQWLSDFDARLDEYAAEFREEGGI
jgi:hypothetical protein